MDIWQKPRQKIPGGIGSLVSRLGSQDPGWDGRSCIFTWEGNWVVVPFRDPQTPTTYALQITEGGWEG